MKEKSSIISHSLNANTKHIGGLIGSSVALLASEIASNTKKPLILVNSSTAHASTITSEIKYFYSKKNSVTHFRDRETLPYDNFSPHQSIISERLSVLHKLNYIKNGILIISESSLLQRLPPINYTIINTINLTLEKKINRNIFIENILTIGYIRVPQVLDYGDFSIRGSLIDIFPMGSNQPIRIDFFDDEIESIRYFDVDTQISALNINSADILPANEIQLDKETIKNFRHYYRKFFEGDPIKSKLYKNIPECFNATRYHSLIISQQSFNKNLIVNAKLEEILALSYMMNSKLLFFYLTRLSKELNFSSEEAFEIITTLSKEETRNISFDLNNYKDFYNMMDENGDFIDIQTIERSGQLGIKEKIKLIPQIEKDIFSSMPLLFIECWELSKSLLEKLRIEINRQHNNKTIRKRDLLNDKLASYFQ